MTTYIALLRAINLGGRTSLAMAELRGLCAEIGWRDVRTYIQSGNVVFKAEGESAELEVRLEAALAQKWGREVPVLVRTAAQWRGYVAANPLAEISGAEPSRTLLTVPKHALHADAVERLQQRAKDGEIIAEANGALWIHYRNGAGTTKLSPDLIGRMAGSLVTARNWRTVLKLHEMMHE
jgi:uncharacterized protein (DUF1697 family)